MPSPPRNTNSHPALSYKEPKALRYSRYMVFWGGGALLFLIVYGMVWFGLSMSLRTEIENWLDARKAEGYLAEHTEQRARISGFPFHIQARLEDVRLGAPERNGQRDWIWFQDEVVFSVLPLPFAFDLLEIDLSGPQTLNLRENLYQGRAETFLVSYDWTSGLIPESLGLEISNLSLQPEQGEKDISLKTLHLSAKAEGQGAYAYDLTLRDFVLPQVQAGLGRTINELILRGQMDRNFHNMVQDIESLASWRDAGGIADVERLQVAFGPLLVQGNGTLALDGNLQPVGAFSARIQGFFRALILLEQAGVINGPDASMAKVVLGVMAKQPENGGPSVISLALSIQDKGLYAGPVRLINLPTLQWKE